MPTRSPESRGIEIALNLKNLSSQNGFQPGDCWVFFETPFSWSSCVVIAVKLAIHGVPSCSASELPQGLALGSASVTTIQMSSPWRLSPPWLELPLLPLLENTGVAYGQRFWAGNEGDEEPVFRGSFKLERNCCFGEVLGLDPWLQRRWLRYFLSGDGVCVNCKVAGQVQRSVQKHWLRKKRN